MQESQPVGTGRLIEWFHREHAPRWGDDPGEFDRDAVRETVAGASRLFGVGRYFDLDLQGWERLPPSPALFVSNHSGGTTIPDVWGFMVGWYMRVGVERPLHPLAHELILSTRATARYFGSRGVLRARPENAWRALVEAGHDVLVLPGGDRDTWRPYTRRWEVEFAGRKGYARLALRAGRMVVPVAHAGAHETLCVLSDGREFARRVGLKALVRAEIWPVHLSLPWGVALGPWPHIPTPARMSYRFGEAIDPTRFAPPGEEPSREAVDALDRAVRGAIQSMLDALRVERAR